MHDDLWAAGLLPAGQVQAYAGAVQQLWLKVDPSPLRFPRESLPQVPFFTICPSIYRLAGT